MTGTTAVVALFTVCNVVRVLAYVPQMLCIARDANGASSISYTSWGLFALSHAATALYALALSGDRWLALNFAANALCCAVIITLTAAKRRRFAQATTQAAAPSGPPLCAPQAGAGAPLGQH